MKIKSIILPLCLLIVGNSFAQKTDALEGLSGKAKAKKLKQEEREAKKDGEYQAIMNEAHDLFANNQFNEALELYNKAHERRPLNQFPKVKIDDVKLAMENWEEPEEVEEKAPTQENVLPEDNTEERIEEAYKNEIEKAETVVKEEVPAPVERKPEKEKKEENTIKPAKNEEILEKKSTAEIREELADEKEDGVYEKTYMDGKKNITERLVVKDGKGDLYKRVIHPWGGVFYFKNYVSVTQNTWNNSYK